jgi:hypothetical protein
MRKSMSTGDLASLVKRPSKPIGLSATLTSLGITPPKPLPRLTGSSDPGGLMASAYLKRYIQKKVAIGNINAIKGVAEHLGGSMVLGYSQAAESSMSTRIATDYKYSDGGQCFAYSLMHLRYKFENKSAADFARWVYSDTPESDVTNPLSYRRFDERNRKLDTWMKRQYYPITRGTMYNIDDYRGKVGELDDFASAHLNPIEPDSSLHSVAKYTLPAVSKRTFSRSHYIESPFSKVLSPIFSSYSKINDNSTQDMSLVAVAILKNQLAERKITKAARKGVVPKRITSKAMYHFSMKGSAFTASNKLNDDGIKEIVNYLQEAIFTNQLSSHVRHEAFVTVGFHMKSGGGHVTSLYSKGLANKTGYIEFFDSNFGIFRFEGHPSVAINNFYTFLCMLISTAYNDIDNMDLSFFRS